MGKPFECILLDATMPGMNGFAVAQAMKALRLQHGNPKIIMMLSTTTHRAVMEIYSHLNISHFMNKPVSRAEFLDGLNKVLYQPVENKPNQLSQSQNNIDQTANEKQEDIHILLAE